MSWKEFFKSKKLIIELVVTIVFILVLLNVFPKFLDFAEQRTGVHLNDPILKLFNPIDLTWITFGIIYACVILTILQLFNKPQFLLLAVQSYGVMLLLRIMAMYLTPLAAPEKLIPLNDPFVQSFVSGDILTQDLFFSGHTATLFLLVLVIQNKFLKPIFIISTIFVGAAVLLQHVHYSIDVLAAPAFAYASYRIAYLINKKLNLITD